MRKKESDISLIRKYLNGELDARAMHQLERLAQDDPFLMDALDGYEKAGNDQQPQLDELAARLKQRISRKERRIIPLKFIAAAASVLAVLTLGGVLLYKSQNEKPEIAQIIKPKVKTVPIVPTKPVSPGSVEQATLTAASNNKHPLKSRATSKQKNLPAASIVIDEQIANADIKTSANDTIVRHSLNEVSVRGYTSQRKKDIASAVTTINADSAKKPSAINADRLLLGQAAGVNVLSSGASAANVNFPKNIIKGRVIGKEDGLPLAGANVRVAGTNKGAVTDVNGMFSLPADSTKTELVIAYIGYSPRQVNIRNRDTLNTIALEPVNSALSEVVVTGYSSQAKADEAAVIDAHPRTGWSNFKKYLKKSAISPDGKSGVVRLSMSVARNGTISDIKIEKGVSTATDQHAIGLINDGPPWVGSTSGKIEKVHVRVKFVK